jgi:hypothetical protein
MHTATDQNQLWSNLRRSQLDTSEKWAYFILDVLPAVPACSRRTACGLLFFRICYCPNSPIRCWEWHLWTSIFQIFRVLLTLNVFLCCCYDSSIMFCLLCLHLAENYDPNLADDPNLAPPPLLQIKPLIRQWNATFSVFLIYRVSAKLLYPLLLSPSFLISGPRISNAHALHLWCLGTHLS